RLPARPPSRSRWRSREYSEHRGVGTRHFAHPTVPIQLSNKLIVIVAPLSCPWALTCLLQLRRAFKKNACHTDQSSSRLLSHEIGDTHAMGCFGAQGRGAFILRLIIVRHWRFQHCSPSRAKGELRSFLSDDQTKLAVRPCCGGLRVASICRIRRSS